MKIYVLNPPFMPHFARDMRWQDTGRGGTLYYPIWIAYATALLEQDYETRLVDAPVWNWDLEQVIADIRAFEPELIVLDTSFPSLSHDIATAGGIKEKYPLANTVMVGPPASQFPEKMLEGDGVDIVARWEYDFTLLDIARALERGKGFHEVLGISFKGNGGIIHNPNRAFTTSEELDRIPFVSPVYKKHLNIKDYFLGYSFYPEVQIFGGRGCPFLCTFCCWTQTFTGRKLRMRSVANVIEELEWIRENLPEVKEVFFEDDTFTLNKRWVLAFTQEYRRRGLDIPWACQARADLGYELLKNMKEANCRVVVVGYESGSDEILRNVKKGITVERTKRFIQDAKRAGMPVHGNFVIGLPGENRETVEKTKKLISMTKSEAITVAVATPFPGTEFYEWAKDNGLLLEENPDDYLDPQGHQKAVISYPHLSAKEIVEVVDEILKGYFLSPRYVPIAIKRVFRSYAWDEIKRLAYSAKMFLRYIGERRHEG